MNGKKSKRDELDIRDRTRAAVALCNSKPNDEDMKLEAFMGLFHPKYQKDRSYMFKLKRR